MNAPLKESKPPSTQTKTGRLIRLALVVVFLGLMMLGGGYWYMDQQNYVREIDARIVSDMVVVSSRVAGWITEIPITEGDEVFKEDVLAQLDVRTAQVHLLELDAALKGVGAEREQVLARIASLQSQMDSRLKTEISRRNSNQATLTALNLEYEYTKDEFKRAAKLYQQSLIVNAEYEQAKIRALSAEQEKLRAQADVILAETKILEIESERQELQVLDKELLRIDFQEEALRARIAQQKLNIDDRSIRSPLTGVVSRTFISEGEHVLPGQRIALLHNPEDIWIEARIRETEIRLLTVGQPVQIHVDAYPHLEFKGQITRIGNASTSVFALLPNPNPSGNFTKVTQRLPVRVSIQQQNRLLKPGMMVEIKIDIQPQ